MIRKGLRRPVIIRIKKTQRNLGRASRARQGTYYLNQFWLTTNWREWAVATENYSRYCHVGSGSHDKRQRDIYWSVKTIDQLAERLKAGLVWNQWRWLFLRLLRKRSSSLAGEPHVSAVPVNYSAKRYARLPHRWIVLCDHCQTLGRDVIHVGTERGLFRQSRKQVLHCSWSDNCE